jgi:curved DNA-binding protein CbpA
MRTHYEILGLEPDCEPEAIKLAFRKLAMQHHPDRNPEGRETDRFLEIRESYGILSDPDLREDYDIYLVEEVGIFEYEPGHEPQYETQQEYSGPEQSGGKGFGHSAEDEGTPFMFLVWLLPPIIIGGLILELLDAPIVALISVPVTLGLTVWARSEWKNRE